MKNWKTSLGALLFIAGKSVQMIYPPYHSVGEALETIAVGWLGYHAVDK